MLGALAGCSGGGESSQQASPPPATAQQELPDLKINMDTLVYSPQASPAKGIGLSPVFKPGMRPLDGKFHWRTNYGYFITGQEPPSNIRKTDAQIINVGEKIYWTFKPAPVAEGTFPVKILLDVEDMQTGRRIASAAVEIQLTSGTAKVLQR